MITAFVTKHKKDKVTVKKTVDIIRYINNPAVAHKKGWSPMWGFLEGDKPITENKEAINWHSWTALLLDYDSGVSIESIQAFCKPWLHFGYTSYNHTPAKPRFRVVLPFTQLHPYELISSKPGREVLTTYFEGVDHSSFTRGRLFYQPAVHPERKHLYRRWCSKSQITIDTTVEWQGLMNTVKTELDSMKVFKPSIPQQLTLECLGMGCLGKMQQRRLQEVLGYTSEQLDGKDFTQRGKGQGINSALCRSNAYMYHRGVGTEDRLQILLRYCPVGDVKTQNEITNIVHGIVK